MACTNYIGVIRVMKKFFIFFVYYVRYFQIKCWLNYLCSHPPLILLTFFKCKGIKTSLFKISVNSDESRTYN